MSVGRRRFYERLHNVEADYAAGEYNVGALMHVRGFRSWANQHIGSRIAIIDIGCGKGVFTCHFVRALRQDWDIHCEICVGVDVVKSPGKVFEDIAAQFQFLQCDVDGTRLPLADGSFDLIICNQVLEHVFETELLVDELRQIIRPGGLCLISVPNLSSWANRLMLLLSIQPLGTEVGTQSITYGLALPPFKKHVSAIRPSGHIRCFTPRALQDLTRRSGFETIGWWNQDPVTLFRMTRWAGRGIGILVTPSTSMG